MSTSTKSSNNYVAEPKWERQANGRKYNPKKPYHVRWRWIDDFQVDGKKDKQRTRTCVSKEEGIALIKKKIGKIKYAYIYDMRRPFGQDTLYKWTPTNLETDYGI